MATLEEHIVLSFSHSTWPFLARLLDNYSSFRACPQITHLQGKDGKKKKGIRCRAKKEDGWEGRGKGEKESFFLI